MVRDTTPIAEGSVLFADFGRGLRVSEGAVEFADRHRTRPTSTHTPDHTPEEDRMPSVLIVPMHLDALCLTKATTVHPAMADPTH